MILEFKTGNVNDIVSKSKTVDISTNWWNNLFENLSIVEDNTEFI